MLLEVNDFGLYCKQADVYIDPWRPVKRALITHGHADHMRWGNQYYLVHKDTVPVLKVRIGADVNFESVSYGEVKIINGVKFSYHPAGHILGSSQIRCEYKGEIWVVTGDYKLHNDGLSPEFEPVQCHHFVTESTFGLPIYEFKSPLLIFDDIKNYWAENQKNKENTIILCYSLGKAQSILNQIDENTDNVFLHGAVANLNESFREVGYNFVGERITGAHNKDHFDKSLIIAPPSVLGSAWMRKFGNYKVAFCSGWMQLRGAKNRKGVDKGFVFSDHCDFSSLNNAVKMSGAEHVYVTHGYETQYAQWLRESMGLDAQIMKTLYSDEEMMQEEGKETLE
ncbi:MAG: ligase-associated DNA damage response exonuclease [Flavobacterium sp.]|nr:ligase-associated DNA damage response exonuclease [Candidatus Neoflavobacterium equi]